MKNTLYNYINVYNYFKTGLFSYFCIRFKIFKNIFWLCTYFKQNFLQSGHNNVFLFKQVNQFHLFLRTNDHQSFTLKVQAPDENKCLFKGTVKRNSSITARVQLCPQVVSIYMKHGVSTKVRNQFELKWLVLKILTIKTIVTQLILF